MKDVTAAPRGTDSPTLSFFGAADSVTGSRYLVQNGSFRMLVDCGLFQGFKVLRERNRAPFPVRPDSVDAVVVSHAHLDHSGYLPALVRDGFAGRIYASEGTLELCRIMLPDSGHLLEEEARFAAKHLWSSHADPRPLYTEADAQRALDRFEILPEGEERSLGPGVAVRLVPAGHILGATGVRLRVSDRLVHFTGDLGRSDDPLMRPPHPFEPADVLVTESTYGDRHHGEVDPERVLGDVVRRVVRRGGVVLIPAFAVGRTETVLLHLSRLRERGEIPDVPIFLNSPMAVSVADVYSRHPDQHRLSPSDVRRLYELATPVHTVDESKLLNLRGGPMIIISASGMLTGGRILHHLTAYGPDPRNAVVLTGFQAGGTRGSALLGGATDVRIFGRDVPIRAEVVSIDTMSAHADAEGILTWMRATASPPRVVYVTHGEPAAADALRARIKRELGWNVRVPEHLATVGLPGPSSP
ncbi:MBL fold metallo-hydrolase [Microbacterium saccharophilum]|uniref:MBL fold metallo-hydrolase n=1 Tax=Microbacterium saccharophilum TaxID=1213358 RepID=A0A5C8HY68_9MICO|nr:MBL fold metallo-hydrolase [Microbacterium saccharophilum]TXK11361.1 MBL fold metallo-hydrolase [Microbacterium saccharophilum]GEP48819.1 MBL fold hydrolase [Microbacterium saccharophilum]